MLILLLLTALQGSPTVGSDPSSYIIGPNDVLAVNVFNQAQLSGKFPVGADGTLAFPLLGRVMVGGLTVGAVEDEMRKRLAAGYVKDPRINVTIEQSRSQLIFIIGEVRQPGALPLTQLSSALHSRRVFVSYQSARPSRRRIAITPSPYRPPRVPLSVPCLYRN